jgi:hypothetical protein
MYSTRPPMRRRPIRRRRRHSHKVYVRRQVLALVLCIGLIFGVLWGLDQLVRVAFPGHHNAGSSTTGKTKGNGSSGGHSTTPKSQTTTPTFKTKPKKAPAGANSVMISAVGDTILGTVGGLPPDPATYLENVKPALAAPIVFGNLEGTLTEGGVSKCGAGSTDCFAFRDPPSYATYLHEDGFTVLNSANNHSHDYGSQGVTDTSAALRTAGIVQAGLPGQIGLTSDAATKVAFVDFAPYPDTNNLLKLAAAKALIRKARTLAPVVIVYMHAGAEGSSADQVTGKEETFDGEDRGNPEAFAQAAIDTGASAVIASGPHVLRGIEFYRGHLIDYSLGDFADYSNFSNAGTLDLSGILKLKLGPKGGFRSATWVSVLLNAEGQPSVDTTGQAAVFVNQLSTEDFGAHAAKIEPNGSIVHAS